jgi:hypothetical protein
MHWNFERPWLEFNNELWFNDKHYKFSIFLIFDTNLKWKLEHFQILGFGIKYDIKCFFIQICQVSGLTSNYNINEPNLDRCQGKQ